MCCRVRGIRDDEPGGGNISPAEGEQPGGQPAAQDQVRRGGDGDRRQQRGQGEGQVTASRADKCDSLLKQK